VSVAGRGELEAFSLRSSLYGITLLAWASGITAGIGNVVGVGSDLVVQIADEAAMVARVVPLSSIVARDVAHPLTRLILRGGMLADVVVVARLLGDDRSEAVRVVWLAGLFFFGGAWLTLTIRGAARAAPPASANISKPNNTTTLMRLKDCYPLLDLERTSSEDRLVLRTTHCTV
jgi:hypothetical protein